MVGRKKEWSCVDDFWGKGCGWKGSGCDCLPFCLLVDLENFVNIGRNGDLPKGCPNCGHRLFSVDSSLVRSKTETSSFGMSDEDYHHAMEFNYEMSRGWQGSPRTPDSSTIPPPPTLNTRRASPQGGNGQSVQRNAGQLGQKGKRRGKTSWQIRE